MRKLILILLCFVVLSGSAVAGGPFPVNDQGVAAKWGSSSVTLHVESGICGPFDNDTMRSKLDEFIGKWADIEGGDLSFSLDTISTNINYNNYDDYYAATTADPTSSDGINPVIFDYDGRITCFFFGSGNLARVLGFAGSDGYNDTGSAYTITDGQVFINCLCYAGNSTRQVSCDYNNDGIEDELITIDCEGDFSEDDLNFTLTHESGHMIGLDHTQVNEDVIVDTIPKAGEAYIITNCESLGGDIDCDQIPTMYPESISPADQLTLTRDDEVAFLTLYGNSTWQNDTCTITGNLLRSNGKELRCADVQAVRSDMTDPSSTIAVVSGAFSPRDDTDGDGYWDKPGECTSGCGAFTLRGLDPAKTYDIVVKPIDTDWEGNSGIAPCDSDLGQLTVITEEEIGDSAGCTAATTKALGDVTTVSNPTSGTGGVTDATGSSSDSSSDSPLKCSLTRSADFEPSSLIFLSLGLFPIALWIYRRRMV